MKNAHARWVIWSSLFVGLILYVAPLPLSWRWFRPELPLLVLFYWNLALPHRVGIFSAAVTGLTLDIINGSAVGALGFGAVISTLFILLNYQRIRQFDTVLQSVAMGLLVGLALIIERWLHGFLGMAGTGLGFVYSLPATILFWPLVRNSLRGLRRYYEVE